ncbi:MAG: NADPH-dependent 7-cyano-7-deazaguanine reductase QueF [Deltaproteobacteria bacterium]|nr:NADPH-dependent 7-cyano-7-deazaguanine reductase QueF [Deltaproteobacteria bacterium]
MKRIKNKDKDRDYQVYIRFPEFTCLCPITSQPDFAEVVIDYVPGEYLVELKSLKIYLNSFRDKGVFHEAVINKILGDFVKKIEPKRVEITGNFNVRGGIYTTVKVAYP